MKLLTLAVAAAFAASGAAFAAGDQQKQKDQSAAGATSPNAPLIVLVPMAVLTPTFANGCWVRLHDSTDFKGNQLSLVGPVDMPNMRTAFGTDWSGQFDSIEVGPKATLTVYDNENYKQKAATFKPGAKAKDLDEKMGTFEQIRSAKVACSGSAQTAQKKDGSSAAGGATSTQAPNYGESMVKLQQATDKLRAAVQAMTQQAAGERRNAAMKQANEALLETQGAMLALPPELRLGAGLEPNYTASMTRLQDAAQRLREAVQAMSQQPAGARRNDAMRQANQALFDTQQAMAQLPPGLRTSERR